MCLPNFIETKDIPISEPLIGYRTWRNQIKGNPLILISENQNYIWSKLEGPHEVKEIDSGIYAYNNNYYNYNNYNNYYNYYNYNNYYYNYNNYYISGIILQYGRTAIHRDGQRSEYARMKTLFLIKESDTEGSEESIIWIKEFNKRINDLALVYECDTITWQDFKESTK